MAVYYTSLAPSNGGGPTVGFGGHRGFILLGPAIVAVTTAMIDNANDDVGLFYAPPGFVTVGGFVDCTDMDSGAALLIDIGDSGDEDRFFAAVNAQAAVYSITMARTGVLYKYTSRTEVRAYCNTAAGTAVAGTLKAGLWGFIDPDFNTTALTAST